MNHPVQSSFTVDFGLIKYPTTYFDIWINIPRDLKVRLCVENHLANKIQIFCYQAYRLFQNLPTRGQRTKANGNSIVNYNPYKQLKINLSFYAQFEVAYKKRELFLNARHDELKAYNQSHEKKKKMQKADDKQRSHKSRQDFIRKSLTKK